MSSIGKIFAILNVALAAAFLGWAVNLVESGNDYKGQLTAANTSHAEELASLNEELGSLREQLNQAKDQQRTHREEAARAKDRAGSAEAQLQQAENAGAQLRGDISKLTDINAGFKATIENLEKGKTDALKTASQSTTQRDDAVRAQQQAERAMRDAQEAMAAAERRIATLEADLVAVRSEAKSLDTQLQTLLAQTNTSLSDIRAVPLIEGAVLEVRTNVPPGLVALNVGSDNGVQRGMTFEIYGPNSYKGQVRVTSVLPDKCSAQVTLQNQGTSMARGDRATTRL